MKLLLTIGLIFYAQISFFAQNYIVHFRQDGVEVPMNDEKVILKKKAFQIEVELLKVDGVFGSCSLNDSLFRIPLDQSLPESDLIQWKIAVEPEYNQDQDMIVSSDGYFYWFYNPKVDTWHRFDKNPKVEKGRVIGTKSIAHFFLSENNNQTTKSINVSEMKQPLYLIFFLMDDKTNKVSQRQRIAIEWK
ncbi:MAG: hypothetical protein ACKOXP_07410 [Flavobacteriales bacterium]